MVVFLIQRVKPVQRIQLNSDSKTLFLMVKPFQFQTALSSLFSSASFYLTWPDGARGGGWGGSGMDRVLGCLLKLVSQFALLRVAKKYETE